jgi:ubiquinone/menaquinone biosynthesis C-methylase UbiE
VSGTVLEAGIGTGRNLEFYPQNVNLTALDFSESMLAHARSRVSKARCTVNFVQADVARMDSIAPSSYDWVLAFFLCCVLPEELQEQAIAELARVLKPGGKFRLLEMRYSDNAELRRRQDLFTPFVEKVYGARFDRNTLLHVKNHPDLVVTGTRYLKHDTYLLIDGQKK